tara:strand:- start:446 stop:1537 length:1092 start_codon:yes stop_codon:yes gene_type:complete
MFSNIFYKKKIIITGHTGFKGSWLTLWLLSLGADICGISLNPITNPSHFELLNLRKKISHNIIDIRNYRKIEKIIIKFKPNYIFHLAAQPLVSHAYKDPLYTFETNVLGTTNILQVIRKLERKCIAILVTSDKSYKNLELQRGYKENDLLGGDEPYGASKAAAEVIINAYYKSFIQNSSKIRIGIGRAGNVIGGGDWSIDRIVPDTIKSWSNNSFLKIRNPHSTRPWQFVLEPLSGYLTLAEKLTKKNSLNGEAFNFGPSNYDKTVKELIEEISKKLSNLKFELMMNNKTKFKESNLLKLNCKKAKSLINWKSSLNFHQTVDLTSSWYDDYYKHRDNVEELSINIIKKYENIAKQKNIEWAIS